LSIDIAVLVWTYDSQSKTYRTHRIVPAETEPTASTPLLTINDRVATVLLRRPREHNRLDPDDLPILIDQLEQVAADPTAQVLVLRGSGSRTFSSGYTVEAILSRLEERTFEKFLNRLENLALPTIVVIQGGIYGGATDLALCCDLRIGVHSSRMFMPAARFGLHYYADGLRRYVSRLGQAAARKLLLTGCTIEAQEMLRIGFLTDLVAPTELEVTVARSIDQLLACDPGAIAAMKRSLNQLADVPPATMGDIEERFLASLRSEAMQQRLAAAGRR
jgi:enoyl-CoA hydratase/carnithine racemase